MSNRGDKQFLEDILESIRRIEEYTQSLDYESFLKNTMVQDAVIRNLEIIGEAVKNISTELKEKYSEISWKDIARMRDKVIHFYFGINWDIVWSVIKDKIPELKNKINDILKDLS